MKITADRKALFNAVQHVGSIITSSLSRPTLRNVKLDVEEDGVYVSATDLEVGVCVKVDNVKIEECGTVLLLEEKFSPILRNTPDNEIHLVGDEDAITLESSDGSVKILSENPENFPIIDKLSESSFEIDPEVFDYMVSRTEFATAQEKGRYALNGILVKLGEEGNLDIVAADGARLANVMKKVVNDEGKEIDCIVSKKGIHEASRLANLCKDEAIKIDVSENKFRAENSKGWMTSQLVEGQFPNYKEVIPTNCKNKIEIDTALLRNAIGRASLMASERSRAVNFQFSLGSLHITSESPDLGNADISIPVDFESEEETIIFNPEYLLDMLQAVKRESIKLEFNAKNTPCLFKSGTDYLYVVSPVVKDEDTI